MRQNITNNWENRELCESNRTRRAFMNFACKKQTTERNTEIEKKSKYFCGKLSKCCKAKSTSNTWKNEDFYKNLTGRYCLLLRRSDKAIRKSLANTVLKLFSFSIFMGARPTRMFSFEVFQNDKTVYATNEAVVCCTDDVGSMGLLDLNVYDED